MSPIQQQIQQEAIERILNQLFAKNNETLSLYVALAAFLFLCLLAVLGILLMRHLGKRAKERSQVEASSASEQQKREDGLIKLAGQMTQMTERLVDRTDSMTGELSNNAQLTRSVIESNTAAMNAQLAALNAVVDRTGTLAMRELETQKIVSSVVEKLELHTTALGGARDAVREEIQAALSVRSKDTQQEIAALKNVVADQNSGINKLTDEIANLNEAIRELILQMKTPQGAVWTEGVKG